MNRTRKKKKGEENRVCFSHFGTVLSIPDSGWFEIPRVRKTERKVQLLRVQKPMWKNGRLRHQCVFEIVGEKGNQEERKLFCQSGDFLLKKNQNQKTILSHHFIQEEIHSVLKIVRRIREMVLQSRKKSTRIEATPTNFHICPQGACPPNTPPPLLSRPSHVCNVSPPPYTSRKCEKRPRRYSRIRQELTKRRAVNRFQAHCVHQNLRRQF